MLEVDPGVLLDRSGLRCCCEGVWVRAAGFGGRGVVFAAFDVAAVGCGEWCWRGEVAGCGFGKDWSSPPVLSRRAQSVTRKRKKGEFRGVSPKGKKETSGGKFSFPALRVSCFQAC